MTNLEILNHIQRTLESNFLKAENHEITPFELREKNLILFNELYDEFVPYKMSVCKFCTLWDKVTDWIARKHGINPTTWKGR